MKKSRFMVVLLLFIFLPVQALANLQLSLTTDASVTDVILMSDDNEVLSAVIDKQVRDDRIEWTLSIDTGVADGGYFYQKDADGNWVRGSRISGLNTLASGGDTTASDAVATDAKPWPEVEYTRYPISIVPLGTDERVQSRCGPAKTYHGAGAYKTYKMISTEALFVEGSYVLVDLDYQTVGKRIVYFPASAFRSVRGVPEASLSSVSAYAAESLIPTFGPGYDYDTFDEAEIAAGTSLGVFFEESGWVFAEFECALGVVRAWMPAGSVAY